MRKIFFSLLAFLILSISFQPLSAAIVIPSSVAAKEPDPIAVKTAFAAFASLSRKEKKLRFKEARKDIKAFKAAKKAGQEPDTRTLLLAILALFLPPLAVYLHEDETNTKFWITLLLFLLGLAGGFIFGWYLLLASVIYALIVILSGSV